MDRISGFVVSYEYCLAGRAEPGEYECFIPDPVSEVEVGLTKGARGVVNDTARGHFFDAGRSADLCNCDEAEWSYIWIANSSQAGSGGADDPRLRGQQTGRDLPCSRAAV